RAAVDREEGAVPSRALIVDPRRDHVLSGARLARDEDRKPRVRRPRDEREDLPHRARLAHELRTPATDSATASSKIARAREARKIERRVPCAQVLSHGSASEQISKRAHDEVEELLDLGHGLRSFVAKALDPQDGARRAIGPIETTA